MSKILKYEDIIRLQTLLEENEFNDFNFKIVTEVDDKETLKKINEDFFYKLSVGDSSKLNDTDIVNINFADRNYEYVIKE